MVQTETLSPIWRGAVSLVVRQHAKESLMRCAFIVSVVFFLALFGCSATRELPENIGSSYRKLEGSPSKRPLGLIISGDTALFRSDLELLREGRTARDSTEGPPPDFVEYTKEPAIIKSMPPDYPAEIRNAGITGETVVKVWVDKKGNPRMAIVARRLNKVLDDNSLIAVMQWKFEPAMFEEKPISIWVAFPLRFRLDR
jgi:TonB family protein